MVNFYESVVVLVEKFIVLVFGDSNKKVVFVMIGVEVVENCVKIVCCYIGCCGVIVFNVGFYGCINLIMVFIGKIVLYKKDFGFFFVDIYYVFFFNVVYDVSEKEVLFSLKNFFKVIIVVEDVVVIIIELV